MQRLNISKDSQFCIVIAHLLVEHQDYHNVYHLLHKMLQVISSLNSQLEPVTFEVTWFNDYINDTKIRIHQKIEDSKIPQVNTGVVQGEEV